MMAPHRHVSRARLFRDAVGVQNIATGQTYGEVLLALVPGLRLYRLHRTLDGLVNDVYKIDEPFLLRASSGELRHLAAAIDKAIDATELFIGSHLAGRSDRRTRELVRDIYRLREMLEAVTAGRPANPTHRTPGHWRPRYKDTQPQDKIAVE